MQLRIGKGYDIYHLSGAVARWQKQCGCADERQKGALFGALQPGDIGKYFLPTIRSDKGAEIT